MHSIPFLVCKASLFFFPLPLYFATASFTPAPSETPLLLLVPFLPVGGGGWASILTYSHRHLGASIFAAEPGRRRRRSRAVSPSLEAGPLRPCNPPQAGNFCATVHSQPMPVMMIARLPALEEDEGVVFLDGILDRGGGL